MFARAHPKVRIEARVARNAELADRLHAGQLDFALAWDDGVSVPSRRSAGGIADALDRPRRCASAVAGVWTTGLFRSSHTIRLAGFARRATAMLDQQRMPWRVVFTSPNLGGLGWCGSRISA